jgi:hypothetical protein
MEKKRKRLFYDLETSQIIFKGWRTGKQFVGAHQILEHQKVISFHWSWEGEDEVHHVHWGLHKQCDKKVMKEIQKQFSKASELVSHNGDKFDMKKIFARMMFHNLDFFKTFKSYDTYKEVKKIASLPSYSLKECCLYFDLPLKLDSGGLETWDAVQFDKDQKALDHLLYYGDGDIVSLKALFEKLKPYMNIKTHHAVLHGGDKWMCPECDSIKVNIKRTYTTAAGTIKHYYHCREDGCGTHYQVNNKTRQDHLQFMMINGK